MSLTTALTLTLAATSTLARDLATARDALSFPISKSFANGDLASQANRVFHDQRSLATTITENIDMYDFSGATDPVGQALALSKVRLLIIENLASTGGEDLLIGGEGSAATWNSPFNADDDAKMVIEPGGVLILVAPSLAGYAVADTTNHLLKIANNGAGTILYNIVVIGSQ